MELVIVPGEIGKNQASTMWYLALPGIMRKNKAHGEVYCMCFLLSRNSSNIGWISANFVILIPHFCAVPTLPS